MRSPVIDALAQELECLLVHRLEHVGFLDADGRQIVDVEEAAVIDLLGRDAPVAEAVGLIGEERLEAVEAARVAPSGRSWR